MKSCALCTDIIDGLVLYEPIGRNNAWVGICTTCAAEHPRSGRYGFNGGRTSGSDMRLGYDTLRRVTGSSARKGRS